MVGRAWQSAMGLPSKGGALLVKPDAHAACPHDLHKTNKSVIYY